MSGSPDYTTTPNLGLFMPNYDMDDGTWGTHLNANASVLDSVLGSSAPGPFLPLSGGIVEGQVTVQPPLMTTTGQAAAHAITSIAQGSGTNGPATAQIGLNVNHSKSNYLTTTQVGEIDGLYSYVRQGGPNSDAGGVVIDVASAGNGFIAVLEGVSSYLNAAGAPTRQVRVQLGSLNVQAPQFFGALLQAQLGVSSQGLLINDVPGQGSFTNFIEGWLSGSQNFVVTNAGAVIAQGGITTKGALVVGPPAIVATNTYTVSATDYTLIMAGSGTMTVTLPTPSVGRILILRNGVAFAVNSASANVYPFSGAALGSIIMPAGPAKFCWLQGDGTQWQTLMAN